MKYFSTLCIIILLALTGCKSDYTAPCRNPVLRDSFLFTSVQLSNIPYTGHDTILYVSDAGDSMVLFTNTYRNNPTYVLTDQPDNPECPNNDYVTFDAVNSWLRDSGNTTELYFGAERTVDSCRYAVSGYGSITLHLSALARMDSTYRDSVFLHNKMFYSVNGFANMQGDSFYINGSLGLLQFRQNVKQFTLQQFNR